MFSNASCIFPEVGSLCLEVHSKGDDLVRFSRRPPRFTLPYPGVCARPRHLRPGLGAPGVEPERHPDPHGPRLPVVAGSWLESRERDHHLGDGARMFGG